MSAKGYFPILTAVLASILGVGLVLWGLSLQKDGEKTGVELMRAGLQICVLVGVGTIVTDAWKRWQDQRDDARQREEERIESSRLDAERESEDRRKKEKIVCDFRLRFLGELTSTYNQIKSVRRLISAIGLGRGLQRTVSEDDIRRLWSEMSLLNTAQLKVEQLKRQAEIWENSLCSDADDQSLCVRRLSNLEQYVRRLIRQWANFANELTPQLSFVAIDSSLEDLKDFAGPSEIAFEENVATPFRELERIISSNVLPIDESLPIPGL